MTGVDVLLLVVILILLTVTVLLSFGGSSYREQKEAAEKALVDTKAHLASEEDRSAAERGRAEAAEQRVLELSTAGDQRITDLENANRNLGTATQDSADLEIVADQLRGELATLQAPSPLTVEDIKRFRENRCVYCGGAHDVACPRVKRIRFRGDGATPMEVEYWPDGSYATERIVWLEDLKEPEATTT